MNWASLLRRALLMGLPPEVFWRLSWREWVMLNGEAHAPLARAALEAMMRLYPDGEKHE
ncbi:MAG: phage tail assembly chaperone [Asticcacaulis sp.]|uniref:phage tail assembly chaperone n=1 Tax=Asticcacaulis sp. TaxID=1872648 RepID=UPI003F7BF69C